MRIFNYQFLHFIVNFNSLIQQPWVRRGVVGGLAACDKNVFYCKDGLIPRKCILTSKSIRTHILPNFCFRDLVAVRIDGKGYTNITFVVCSANFPYDTQTLPPTEELQELVNYCKIQDWPLIVGCDANAHHTLWGS
ncbi:hypothetical protein HHI36_002985 [Cryptolaemus montrouzieri]|uniref:Endonuclease/exonuclease/phosphatase domain-containing protein n=1 Tax=Cryptolaemus montrouzieri TaxID=559131 RepID=A0ABD2PD19_9CUCU